MTPIELVLALLVFATLLFKILTVGCGYAAVCLLGITFLTNNANRRQTILNAILVLFTIGVIFGITGFAMGWASDRAVIAKLLDATPPATTNK